MKSLESDTCNPGALIFGEYIADMAEDHTFKQYLQRYRSKVPSLKEEVSYYSHQLEVYLGPGGGI